MPSVPESFAIVLHQKDEAMHALGSSAFRLGIVSLACALRKAIHILDTEIG